jgi:hypothetical protein
MKYHYSKAFNKLKMKIIICYVLTLREDEIFPDHNSPVFGKEN